MALQFFNSKKTLMVNIWGILLLLATVTTKANIIEPTQLTFETEAVQYAALSHDAKQLYYVTEKNGEYVLWRREQKAKYSFALPQRVFSSPNEIRDISLSKDAKAILYVGTEYDVKGDIYLFDFSTQKNHRLTGRQAEEGAPVFAADGKHIFFHQRSPGQNNYRIFQLAVANPSVSLTEINLAGDAMFPVLTQDGVRLAFISRRQHPQGDLFVYDFYQQSIVALTNSPAITLSPAWADDGDTLYASQIELDTNQDQVIDNHDRSALYQWRYAARDEQAFALPVTFTSYSAWQPQIVSAGIYFLSNIRANVQLFSLPLSGALPARLDVSQYQKQVLALQNDPVSDDYAQIFLHERFAYGHSEDQETAAALYETANLYLKNRHFSQAKTVYQHILLRYPGASLIAGLSHIELLRLSLAEQDQVMATDALKVIQQLKNLPISDNLGAKERAVLDLQRQLAIAKLDINYGRDVNSLSNALDQLISTVGEYHETPTPESKVDGVIYESLAEAYFLQAEIFQKLGDTNKVQPGYLSVIDTFPLSDQWYRDAIDRMVNLVIVNIPLEDGNQRRRQLHQLADKNLSLRPDLSMAALNRLADDWYQEDEWSKAKEIYLQVLKTQAGSEYFKVAARLSLAEIYYREALYRDAIDLYQSVLQRYPSEDRVYRLARRAYVKKSLAAAESLYNNGEIYAAVSSFHELRTFEPDNIEAHRGYIKSAILLGDSASVLSQYQTLRKKQPNNPLLNYAVGLIYTYQQGDDPLLKAQNEITTAIAQDGGVEYFYQTLGYVFENLATRFGQPEKLVAALESYRTALSLNDPFTNLDNRANLLLNVGNAHFILKQYGSAYGFYQQRLATEQKFPAIDNELIFFQRYAVSAFHLKETQQSIDALKKALVLLDQRTNPMAASAAYDRLSEVIFAEVLSRDVIDKQPEAKRLANVQSELNKTVFSLTHTDIPSVASSEWQTYQQSMQQVLDQQRQNINDIVVFLKKSEQKTDQTAQIEKRLQLKLTKVIDALAAPQRFSQLKAELLDRIGLAYQDQEQWSEAIDYFQQALNINQFLELRQNQLTNQRAIAYNYYQWAGQLSGQLRNEKLHQAESLFSELLSLIEKYGIEKPATATTSGDALFTVNLQVAFNSLTGTQAAQGFDEQQTINFIKAFLIRIYIELGDYNKAETYLTEQLNRFPEDKSISEEDSQGVALLLHRTASLAYAKRDWPQAYELIKRGANISHQVKDMSSLIHHVLNMGYVLSQMAKQDVIESDAYQQRYWEWLKLDRLTLAVLIATNNEISLEHLLSYHNNMSVLLQTLWTKSQADMQYAAVQISVKRHLHKAKKLIDETNETLNDRNKAKLFANVMLNMAVMQHNEGTADDSGLLLGKALDLTQRFILPELEWRILARLDRLEEAWQRLGSVPMLRMGVMPDELFSTFYPLILQKKTVEGAEQAFNFTEQLAEYERVNRFVPMLVQQMTQQEKNSIRSAYQRMLRLRNFNPSDSSSNISANQRWAAKRIQAERQLLIQQIGEDWQKLPMIRRLSYQLDVREDLLIWFGLAIHLEEEASSIAFAGGRQPDHVSDEKYQNIQRQLHEFVAQLDEHYALQDSPPIFRLLMPRAATLNEVMEVLPDDVAMLRLVPVKLADGEGQQILRFLIMPDDIKIAIIPLAQVMDVDDVEQLVIASEKFIGMPSLAEAEVDMTAALSASHWYQAYQNQKPFRRRIKGLSNEWSAGDLTLPTAFIFEPMTDTPTDPLAGQLSDAHTLLLKGKIQTDYSVAMRATEQTYGYLNYQSIDQRRYPLLDWLSSDMKGLSLVMMPASKSSMYYGLHFLSMLGVPSVLLNKPQQASDLPNFLSSYADSDLQNAALETDTATWLVGSTGMTAEQAMQFASQSFARLVKQAQLNYQQQRYQAAFSDFELATNLADETPQLKKYLTQLLTMLRDSAFKSGEYKKSEQAALRLVDWVEKTQPDSSPHAMALLQLGVVRAKQEKYKPALENIELALEMFELLELPQASLMALEDAGMVLEQATEYTQAIDRFQFAADLSVTLNKQQVLARQYEHIGRLYDLRINNYGLAKKFYQKSFEIYQTLTDHNGQVQALINRGRAQRLLGFFNKAEGDYLAALLILDTHDDSILRAKVMIERANNAWYQAQYQQAFDLLQTAKKIVQRSGWSLGEVIIANTSGLIWWTLGENEKSLRILQRALEQAGQLENRADEVATSHNNMGVVLRSMRRFDQAMTHFSKATTIDQQLKSRWGLAYDWRNQAQALLLQGNAQQAIPLFNQAIEMANSIGNRINEAKALLGLADAYADTGNTISAIASYQKAKQLADDVLLPEVQWRSLYGMGRIAYQNKQLTEAKEYFQAALQIVEDMRAELKIEQLKNSFINDKLSLFEDLIRLLLDQSEIEQAFNVAERSRARSFIDLLGNHQLQLGSQIEQQLYDNRLQLTNTLKEYKSLVVNSEPALEKQKYTELMDKVQDELDDLNIEIQNKHPQLASLVVVNPADVKEIQQFLDNNVGLLAYYALPEETIVWWLTKDQIQVQRMPINRAALQTEALEYRRRIQNLEPLLDQSQRLYQQLIAPFAEEIDKKQFIGIVPHGNLHYLSFATLHSGEDYLIDKKPLFYLPSASILRYTLSRRDRLSNRKVLALGNPDINNPDFALPFAEQEVNSIHWSYPDTTVLTGKQATERWLTQHIHEFGIIHIASHGEFDPINPLFSALKLSPSEQYDGNLLASEIFGFHVNADLVLLSACQTGLGRISLGDDVVGLNRSFFYAGTHSIISSLWKVSDISTALLTKRFYREYKKHNKADALRKATLHVKNRYSHPGYWGAFTLAGDYQ